MLLLLLLLHRLLLDQSVAIENSRASDAFRDERDSFEAVFALSASLTMAVTLAQFSQTIRRQQYAIYGDMPYPQFAKAQQSSPSIPYYEQVFYPPETLAQRAPCRYPELEPTQNDDWMRDIPSPPELIAAQYSSYQAWPAIASSLPDESPAIDVMRSPARSTYSQSSSMSRSSSTTTNNSTYSASSVCLSQSNALPLAAAQNNTPTTSRPFLRLGRDDVWDSVSGIAVYTLHRGAASFSARFSTRPALTLRQASTGVAVGSARSHTIGSCDIVLVTRERNTTISPSGVFRKRWNFTSMSSTGAIPRWSWRRDPQFGGAVLDDGKMAGHVLARVKDDLLSFEDPSLCDEACDEIVLSAVALAEALRKPGRGRSSSDLTDIFGHAS